MAGRCPIFNDKRTFFDNRRNTVAGKGLRDTARQAEPYRWGAFGYLPAFAGSFKVQNHESRAPAGGRTAAQPLPGGRVQPADEMYRPADAKIPPTVSINRPADAKIPPIVSGNPPTDAPDSPTVLVKVAPVAPEADGGASKPQQNAMQFAGDAPKPNQNAVKPSRDALNLSFSAFRVRFSARHDGFRQHRARITRDRAGNGRENHAERRFD